MAAVAWRPGWWGPDGELATAAEAVFTRSENGAAPILRAFVRRWPLSRDDRAVMSQFMAIHALRTPAWRDYYYGISGEAVREELQRRPWNPNVAKRAAVEFLSDRLRVETLLKQIPRMASLFMSMHWSLVSFDEPLIASCDQPVICVPRLEPWQRLPIQAMPQTGLLETAEVRFPIDPWHLLLLSWSPQPDLEDPVRGEFRHAADVNRSTRGQADRDWFHRPEARPPLLAPLVLDVSCQPISYDLVPGYAQAVARDSRRRAEADEIIKELIEDQTTDRMRFVVVTPKATADS